MSRATLSLPESTSESVGLFGALMRQVAHRVLADGHRVIALYGAGRHTRAVIREPWVRLGIRVAAVLDDAPRVDHIAGVPVVHPARVPPDVQAVVLSSDAHERDLARAAERALGGALPVYRIYTAPEDDSPQTVERALVERFGVDPDDAAWLMANRMERHDATLPMLPPHRTEMHLRRYELALPRAHGARALDAASGTGYGAAMLARAGGAREVVGVEGDARAADYATRRHGLPGVAFLVADVTDMPFPDRSFDLITSMETIEHLDDPQRLVDECSRLLRPGGTLVLSTPNERGLTAYHRQSLGRGDLERMLGRRFGRLEWFGQIPGDEPRLTDLPPGVFPLDEGQSEAETIIAIASRR